MAYRRFPRNQIVQLLRTAGFAHTASRPSCSVASPSSCHHSGSGPSLGSKGNGSNNNHGRGGSQAPKRMLLAAAPIIFVSSLTAESEDGKEQPAPTPLTAKQRAAFLRKMDQLHKEEQYREEYDALLPYHDSNDYDMLWRLARVSILCREPAKDDTRKELTVQAVRLAKKAIELNGDNAMCQLWFGITVNHMQPYRSVSQKVSDVGVMYAAFARSLLLDQKNAFAWHSFGQWHYHVAETGWFSWKAVEVANSGLQKGTFEEALACFLRAEDVEPGFYIGNLHYLAKTYAQLGQLDKQKEVLEKIVSTKPRNEVDVEYILISRDILQKMEKQK